MGWPVWLTGLGASLAINAYRTLKLPALGITVRRSNYPLCGLPGELRFITGNNILEELELDVCGLTTAPRAEPNLKIGPPSTQC